MKDMWRVSLPFCGLSFLVFLNSGCSGSNHSSLPPVAPAAETAPMASGTPMNPIHTPVENQTPASHLVSPKPPQFEHIFLVVLENEGAKSARSAPFLKKLVKMGGYLSNYHANGHPSEPNYITLLAGSNLGVFNDGIHHLHETNLVDLLEAKGLSWKAYAENFPGHCRQRNAHLFAQRHVPFLSFTNITKNPSRCAKIVDARHLSADIGNGELPNFAMYTPNLHNDGHDTSVQFADNWLQKAFARRLQDPRFIDKTLFIVTFDESDYDDPANRVYTVLYNPEHVRAGSVDSKRFDHASLLKLIEDNFGLGHLGRADASSPAITEIFK